MKSVRIFALRRRVGAKIAGSTIVASLYVVSALSISGQTADNNLPKLDESEVIVLSPFVVSTSDDDSGYIAGDTLAGSRLRANLRDIGAPITELTRAMMDDLGASNINGIAEFLPSVEQETSQSFEFAQNTMFFDQTHLIRGLQTDNKARNYFNSLVPSDAYNTSRVTLSRGANSILFGAANPAGIFNTSTKEANLQKDSYQLQFRTDEYGTSRTVFDSNKVIIPGKLAGNLILLNEQSESWRQPLDYKDQKRIYAALTYRPWQNTIMRVNFEQFDYERSAPSPLIPFDRVNLWLANGKPTRISNTGNIANPAGVGNLSGAISLMGMLGSNPLGSGSTPAIVQSAQRYAVSTSSPVGVNNSFVYSLPSEFFDGSWPNFGGNSRIDSSDGWVGDFSVEQELVDGLYLQLAAHGEEMHRDLAMVLNDWNLLADASQTLQDGVTPNPNVGRYMIGGGNPFWNIFDNKRLHYRAALTYDFDLTKRSKWLGVHQFAGFYQVEYNYNKVTRTTLRNTTPLPGSNANILNAHNVINVLMYLNPDGSYDGVSRDPRTFDETFSINGVTARYFRQTAGTNELVKIRSALGVMQNRWLGGRFVTTAGVRRDTQDLFDADRTAWPRDLATNEFVLPSQYQRTKNTAGSGLSDTTYSVGGVFHLVENRGVIDYASVFYNKSTNFQPTGGARGFQNELIGPSTGETEDFGVKFGLFNGRVSTSVSRFNSGQLGVRSGGYSVKNLNPIWEFLNMLDKIVDDKVVDTHDQTASGTEIEINVKPFKNWNIAVFASKNSNVISNKWPSSRLYLANNLSILRDPAVASQVTSNGQTVETRTNGVLDLVDIALAAEGTRSSQLREWKASMVTKYNFTEGRLKGLGVGGYYRWTSPDVIGYQRGANGALDTNKPYYGRRIADTGVNVSYSRDLAKICTWTIQLNVNNVFDEADPLPTRADQASLTDLTQVNRLYRLQAPRTWILTNTFRF